MISTAISATFPKYIDYMISEKDRERYSDALDTFAEISRTRGKKNSSDEILECIKTMEYFEEYEKCKSLFEILKIKQNAG